MTGKNKYSDFIKNINFSKQTSLILFVTGLLVLGGFFLLDFDGKILLRDYTVSQDMQQLLKEKGVNFNEVSKYFKDLAEQEGAEYAFTVLAQTPLPPNIDLHLLGHVVGDELYKQEGFDGISVCTQDFRNACSHSIAIGSFNENGEGFLSSVSNVCQDAPGGKGAYTMCFHGLGHGVLAYTGYDLEKAVELCGKTGTEEYGNREYIECVGGTVMEMIWGGGYNNEAWLEQSKKYFKKDDPLYPCTADFISEEIRDICYRYLTPHLFDAVGANLGAPTQNDFKKSFELCDVIPKEDSSSREACFGGMGKEFPVLAIKRDIRDIESISNEKLSLVFEWCSLAGKEDGITACLKSALSSFYWGGENDRSVAIRFCNIMDDNYYQSICYKTLIIEVSYFIDDLTYKNEFCTEIPPNYHSTCKATLGP